MNNSLYEKMYKIKSQKDLKDIMYCGKIELIETDNATNQKIKIIKDVYIPMEKENDNNEIYLKFLDENGEVIAVDSKNGFCPSSKYLDLLHSPDNDGIINILKDYAAKEGLTLIVWKKN